MINLTVEKIACTRCKQEFPLTIEYFRLDARKRSGFSSHCKQCSNELNKQSTRKRMSTFQLESIIEWYNEWEDWKKERKQKKEREANLTDEQRIHRHKIKVSFLSEYPSIARLEERILTRRKKITNADKELQDILTLCNMDFSMCLNKIKPIISVINKLRKEIDKLEWELEDAYAGID